MGAYQYILRRVILSIPVFLGIITIAFFAARLVPADPAAVRIAEGASAEEYARVRKELGLDQPLVVQWLRYVGAVARGDLGLSIRVRRPVAQDLRRFFAATVELGIVAFCVAVAAGVPLGVLSAVHQDRALDHVTRIVSLGGVAAPIFWIALVAQLVFYGDLGWLPAGGRVSGWLIQAYPVPTVTGFLLVDSALARNWAVLRDAAVHLAMPAAVLAYPVVALITRMTRSAMLDVLTADYVRTARSLGLTERSVIYRHALRNAAPTVATIVGLAFGHLLQGSVLVETVFNWPGLGLYAVGGIKSLDYPIIVAVAWLICTVYVVVNLLVDLSYPLLDPRVRYG